MNRLLGILAVAVLASVVAPATAHAQCSSYPTLCGLQVQSTIEQPDLEMAIDVVLVGEGFVDMAGWHNAAAAAIARLKAQTAAGVYQSTLFNFHVVDVVSATTNISNTDVTDTALGGTTATMLTANMGKANTAALNAPDVDVVVVIFNGAGRANANYPSQLTSGGTVRLSSDPNPISHEFGHALFNLGDEYEEATYCTTPGESAMVRNRNLTTGATCAKFSTTSGAGCVQGGMYCSTGVYRPAAGCLMRTSGNVAGCPVCARTMTEMLLEKRTGGDVSDPWAVTTYPANNSTVSGVVNLSSSSFDDFQPPTRVSFTIDGVYVGSAVTPTNSVPFNVDVLPNGAHTLAIYMEDTHGHARRGPDVTFNTNNTPVVANLTLAVSTPAAGASVNNFAYVSGTLGGGAAAWVALLVDGTVVQVNGRTLAGGVGFNWDGSAAAAGPHTLQLQASNDVGALFSSSTVNITLTHTAGGPGGSGGGQIEGGAYVGIMAPTQWDTVSNSTLVRVNTNGFARPTTLTLKLDGAAIMPSPLPSLTVASISESDAFVDTSTWSPGPHYLEVTASDGAQSNTSLPVPISKVALTTPEVFLYLDPAGSYARDTVTVRVAAMVSSGTPTTHVLLDGVELFSLTQAQGSYAWNTTTATNGAHQLSAVTTDSAGRTGTSDTLFLQVDNAAPTVSIRSPANGDTFPPGVVLVLDTNADVGSYVTQRQLFVDGNAVMASNYQPLFAVLAAGSHQLRVRVTDAVGHATDSAPVTITVASCQSTGCDDGNTCTVDTCQPSGLCSHARTAGCCVTSQDCADTDPCTTNTCSNGTCTRTNVAACCNFGFACADGSTTTQDLCSGEGGTCSNPLYPTCLTASQCDDGDTCTVDACAAGGQCSHARTPNCCTTSADCDDGRSCTVDSCNGGTCTHAPQAACCDTAQECDDGMVCTQDQCVAHVCVHAPSAGCCLTSADCVTTDPCNPQSCGAGNRCVGTATANCCTFGFQCDDRNACTADTCQGAQCGHAPNGTCCVTASDCTAGNACTSASCDAMGKCQYAAVSGCCLQDQDCADADVCTQDTCTNNACTHSPVTSCCHTATDCSNTNTCLTMACTSNVCSGVPVAGCCNTNADCGDGNACTTDACTNHTCAFTPVAACCNVDPDCADADACTADTCVGNACVHTPFTACCNSAAECDDGNGCTVDNCVSNACVATPVAGCCLSSADCADGDACTEDLCTNGVCAHPAVAGCCVTSADCADQDTCTVDTCTANACTHQPTPGCCHVDPECDDGNTCTVDTCTAQGACTHAATPGCVFDAGTPVLDASVASDASVTARDASATPDAAGVRDSGSQQDAAVASNDAAVASSDAGEVVQPPSGDGSDGGSKPGCTCAQPEASPSWMALGAATLLLRFRRRR